MKYLFLSLFLCSSITAFSQDTLSIKDIPAAERLMDLQFKPTERDSLFDNVKDNMKEQQKMRQYKLDNSVPLSTWQSPLIPEIIFRQLNKF